MNETLQLPEILEPYREKILSTRMESIQLLPQADPPDKPSQSCIGGTPYLPKSSEYPTNSKGEQLFFLAQVNFEEMPKLTNFPGKGLLQFFIFDDGTYGQDPEAPSRQENFRVIYFPNIETDPSKLITDFSFLRDFINPPLDGVQSYSLTSSLHTEYLPVDDYRFEKIFGKGFFRQFEERSWEAYDEFYERFGADGHKLGGYPDFAQDDPRDGEQGLELLLQVDSDFDIGCMWGDVGVGNFFIKMEDLNALDFSNVHYFWDCS